VGYLISFALATPAGLARQAIAPFQEQLEAAGEARRLSCFGGFGQLRFMQKLVRSATRTAYLIELGCNI
jgi:hypothetical protein